MSLQQAGVGSEWILRCEESMHRELRPLNLSKSEGLRLVVPLAPSGLFRLSFAGIMDVPREGSQCEVYREDDLEGRDLAGLLFRKAGWSDIPALLSLINGSYRSTQGWTHEGHLLRGDRVDSRSLRDIMTAPDSHIELLTSDEGQFLGCVQLRITSPQAYLSMLTVNPTGQGRGHGRALLDRAAELARAGGALTLGLSVIWQRPELVAYYERRGYRRTGSIHPFPTDQSVGQPLQELHLLEMELALRG